MTFRLSLTPEQRWFSIREAWERGHFDRMRRLLLADSTGLPPAAAEWLLGVLTGEVKRKRGRQPIDPAEMLVGDVGRPMQIRQEFRGWLMFYQHLAEGGPAHAGTPKERALEHVAKLYGMTPDAVSHIVHPRRRRRAPK